MQVCSDGTHAPDSRRPGRIPPPGACGRLARLLEHSLDKRIAIRRDFRAEPPVVTGDPTLLQNALLNLALNARDAMPEGGEIVFATEELLTVVADLLQR